jgi:AmmeMemoRadiSam system protein B
MSDESPAVSGRTVRQPAVAGMFYPAARERLEAAVDSMLDGAPEKTISGRIVALVEPHAGYAYSGEVAAAGYRLLDPAAVEHVFLVGPSHRAAFRGVAAWDGDGFLTPLGEVPVDRDLVRELVSGWKSIAIENWVHEGEHSLEVQLPFLQRRVGGFGLVPLVMGRQDPRTIVELGEALAAVASALPASLLVASSDLSHYHSYEEAVELDHQALDQLAELDAEGFMTGLRSGRFEACGGGPIASVIHAARALGAREANVLSYRNSGDVTGDRSQVVGYQACAITA